MFGLFIVGIPVWGADVAAASEQGSVTEANAERSAIEYLSLLGQVVDPASGAAVNFEGRSLDGFFIFGIKNDWIDFYHRVPNERFSSRKKDEVPGLSESLKILMLRKVAPRSFIESTLWTNFGLHLDDVYVPASPPFYTNGKGLVLGSGNVYLQVRGARVESENSCWTALVDVESARVDRVDEISCFVE